jgi:hypothetical protein
MSSSREGDAVGYGNPPKKHQFKKGQSGNPKGRPTGSRNVGTILEETLTMMVTIRDDGQKRKISAPEALVMAVLRGALKGDARFLRLYFDLLWRIGSADPGDRVSREEEDKEDQAILERHFNAAAGSSKTDEEPRQQ